MESSIEKQINEIADEFYASFCLLDEEEAIKSVHSLNIEKLFGLNPIRTVDDLNDFLGKNDLIRIIKVELFSRLSEEAFPHSENVAFQYLEASVKLALNNRLSSDASRELVLNTIGILSLYCFNLFPHSLNIAVLFSEFLKLTYKSCTDSSVLQVVKQCIAHIYNGDYSHNKMIIDTYNEIVNGIISTNESNESEEYNKRPQIKFSKKATDNSKRLYQLVKDLDSPDIVETSDPFFVDLLEKLKEYFDYLRVNKDNIQLIQIYSKKRRIYTLNTNSLYGIIWDTGYWSLFQSFLEVIRDISRVDNGLNSLLNKLAGTNLSLLELLQKTFGHLDSLLITVNPEERIPLLYFESVILRIYGLDESNLKLNNDTGNKSDFLITFGKIHVMFHEIEHILNRLEEKSINDSFSFDTTLKLHRDLLFEYGKDKTANGFTKSEQIKCIDKIISQKGKWKRIYKELGTDYNAFVSAVFALNDLSPDPLPDIITWCVCGSKLISMFHTYRSIVDFYVSAVLELKGKGIVDIEKVNEEIGKIIEDYRNEIEFRDVLSSHLQQILLCIFAKESIISVEDYNSIMNQRNQFIEAYQCFFPDFFVKFQEVALHALLIQEESMKIVIEIPVNDDYKAPQLPDCLKDVYTIIDADGYDGESVYLFLEHLDTVLSIASNITTIATFIVSMIAIHKSKVKVSGRPIPSTASQTDVEDILSEMLVHKTSNTDKKSTNTKKNNIRKNAKDNTSTIKPGKLFLEVDGMQIEINEIKKKAKKLSGDVYIVTNEKKIYDTNGKSLDIF